MEKYSVLSSTHVISTEQKCLIVLGMHRSGTSAFTGVLNLLGANIGESIMLPAYENPKGFFENRRVAELNDQILQTIGTKWFTAFIPRHEYLEIEELAYFKQSIKTLMEEEFPKEGIIAIKDPRLCLVLPIWQSVLEELGINPKYIIALRDPSEISQSLKVRNGIPISQSFMLWMNHLLQAEYYTRTEDRTFVRYDDLIEKPMGIVRQISRELNVFSPELINQKRTSINTFIDPQLKHHNSPIDKFEDVNLQAYYHRFYQLINEFENEKSDLINTQQEIDEIRKRHYKTLLVLGQVIDIAKPQVQLLFDTGKGFNSTESIRKPIDSIGQKSIEFDVDYFKNIKAIRIKPLDYPCIIHVSDIELFSKDGTKYHCDDYSSNAYLEKDGQLFFDDLNAQINLHIHNDFTFLSKIIINITYNSYHIEALLIMNNRNKHIIDEDRLLIDTNGQLVVNQNNEIQQLNQKLKKLQKKLNAKKQTTEVIRSRILLKDELLKNKEVFISYKEDLIRQKEDELNELKKQLVHGKQTIRQYCNSLEELKIELQNTKKASANKSQQATQTYKAFLEQKNKELQVVKEKMHKIIAHNADNKNRIAQLEGDLQERENTLSILSADVAKKNQAEQKVKQLEADLQEREDKLKLLSADIAKKEEVAKNNIRIIQEKNQQINVLEQKARKTKDQLNERQQTYTVALNDTKEELETVSSILNLTKEQLLEKDLQELTLVQAIDRQDNDLSDLRLSISFRIGWFLTAPFRLIYNLFTKTAIKNSKIWLLLQFVMSAILSPFRMLKNINSKNIKTLGRALKKESPRQIAKNLFKLLHPEKGTETDLGDLNLYKELLPKPDTIQQKSKPETPIVKENVFRPEQEVLTNKKIEIPVNKTKKSRPSVLFISPNLPDYDTSSGGKRATRMLELLSKDCDIYVFSPGDRPAKYIQKLEESGIIVLQTYDFTEVKRKIFKIDVLIFAWYYMYQECSSFVKLYPNAKIILDSVDVHWIREERSLGLWEGLTEEKVRTNKRKEIAAYKAADIVWVVTDNDRLAVLKEIPNADIRVVSNIHDPVTTVYTNPNTKDILFLGGYRHYPNISAVKKLALEIFPKVRVAVPDAKLLIAGSYAPKEVMELGKHKNVEYLGFIEEEDMDALYQRTLLSVSPLLAGAGIKGKICEAISYMTPVVTNAIGNEGIDLVNQKSGLITEDYTEMANSIVKAMRKEFDLEAMTKNAQQKLFGLVGSNVVKKRMLSSIYPEISICIVTWNRKKLVKRCIDSILGNTNYPNYKILVHSNGCTDGTQEYLRAAAKFTDKIIPILSEKNEVFVLPNNAMMQMFPDNDAVLVNNDVYVTPNWLTGLYNTAYSSKNYGIVGSKILYPDGKLQEFGSELYANGTGRNIGKWDDPNKSEYKKLTKVGYVSGCSMYIKRSTMNRIGVFDEDFHPCYCEDSDYCYTAWENGIQTVVTPQSIIFHDEGGTSGTDTSSGFKSYQIINMKKFLAKHQANLTEINERIHSNN